MRAVLLVAKAEARRRAAALLGLALIVGLVGTAVLGSVAGARRTDSALDRFTDATATADGRAFAFALGRPLGGDLVGEVGALDGVREVGGFAIYSTDALFDVDVSIVAPTDDVAFRRLDRPLLLDGRYPDPSSPDEVVLSDLAVERLGLHTGDRFRASTFSPEDCAALAEDDFQGFNGPAVDLEVVGEVRRLDELQASAIDSGPTAIATPAFAAAHAADTCASAVSAVVRYEPGAGPSDAEMVAATRRAAPGVAEIGAGSVEKEYLEALRSAIDVAVIALLVFAAVTAAAGALALIQAVLRQTEATTPIGGTLGALGLTRAQQALAGTLPLVAAAVLGAVLAGIGTVVVSPLFPLGVARRAEPDPGLRPDVLVLIVGLVALVVLVAVVGFLASRRRVGRVAVPERASVASRAAGRLRATPSIIIGLRLADDRTRSRTAVRTAMVGTGLAVAGLCAVAVLSASLSGVLDDPARFGWPWTAKPDVDSPDPEATVRAVAQEEQVEAVAVLHQSGLEVDDHATEAFGLEVIKGTIDFPLLGGRLPAADDEIVLAEGVAPDVDLGSSLRVRAGDEVADLTLVGRAVLPQIDNNGVDAALVQPEALDRLSHSPERSLVLTYAPGVDEDALEAHLEEAYGLSFPAYARPDPPDRLLHLDEIRGLLVALALFFTVLGIVGLAHALAVAGRRHRGFFATLRALGFRRRQVVRSVATCSAAIVLAGIVVGMPLGIALGRLVWTAIAGDLGVVDAPSVPAVAILSLALLTLGGALIVATPSAWLAGRCRPAAVLRAE